MDIPTENSWSAANGDSKFRQKAINNIYLLSFFYRGRQHQTKILFVKDEYAPMFKVVVPSCLSPLTPIFWLKKQHGNWKILLGSVRGELVEAISAALEKLGHFKERSEYDFVNGANSN